MLQTKIEGSRGFTLIELLIVVAIIAILAAIAVPNFLEAQTRSKVSRMAADMRSIRTGIESYAVDNNHYPETDWGEADRSSPYPGFGLLRLTTPLAYMSSAPGSPFQEEKMGTAGPRNSIKMRTVLYVRAELPKTAPRAPWTISDGVPADGKDKSYNDDRAYYIGGNSLAYNNAGGRSVGDWMMKSVGPDNIDDRSAGGTNPRVYDPTNGTVSAGDIIVFSDTQGFAQQQSGN